MLRKLILLLVLLVSTSALFAQTETVEKRVEIDSATGERRVVYVTAVTKSEDITPYTDMLNINPLKFFYAYNLTWSHRVSLSSALSVGGEYGSLFSDLQTEWGANAEFRIYPGKKAMHGFYVAPNASYKHYQYKGDYYDANIDQNYGLITLGVQFGWQWFPYESFPMGLALGLDDYIPVGQDVSHDYSIAFYTKGIWPSLKFDLGFAW